MHKVHETKNNFVFTQKLKSKQNTYRYFDTNDHIEQHSEGFFLGRNAHTNENSDRRNWSKNKKKNKVMHKQINNKSQSTSEKETETK